MNHPQYLLRFDDICPTMNCRVWEEIESILVERGIKPILAVVPDNQDPVLQVNAPAADFWDRVRAWQEWGWTIALHGFQHRYISNHAGLVAIRKKSEFAGLLAGEQREKLQRGKEIFKREGIKPRVWIAPGTTFDATTVSLLPEFGIRIICDGHFRFPFVTPLPMNLPLSRPAATLSPARSGGEGRERRLSWVQGFKARIVLRGILSPSEGERVSEGRGRGTSDAPVPGGQKDWMTWIPQQLYCFRPAPAGVWTVCYHHNHWTASQMRQFRKDVDDFGANIASLEEVLERNAPRESKWSEWMCAQPRLSRWLIRAELKLWEMIRGGRQTSRKSEADLPSSVTRHPSP